MLLEDDDEEDDDDDQKFESEQKNPSHPKAAKMGAFFVVICV